MVTQNSNDILIEGRFIISRYAWRRGEGDLNPRVLSDNGLAIHRLAWLGHLRLAWLRIMNCLLNLCRLACALFHEEKQHPAPAAHAMMG